jgi:hypothetical protein
MRHRIANPPIRCVLLWAALLVLFISPRLLASPSQQDVFKSIQDSMGSGKEVDSTPVYLLVGGGIVTLVVVSLLSRRQHKGTSTDALNHPGKLLKEVLQDVPLKAAEVKQLKVLAGLVHDHTDDDVNPLTFLLCPSLMAKGLKEDRGKVDRKTVAQMVRRLRMTDAGRKT